MLSASGSPYVCYGSYRLQTIFLRGGVLKLLLNMIFLCFLIITAEERV